MLLCNGNGSSCFRQNSCLVEIVVPTYGMDFEFKNNVVDPTKCKQVVMWEPQLVNGEMVFYVVNAIELYSSLYKDLKLRFESFEVFAVPNRKTKMNALFFRFSAEEEKAVKVYFQGLGYHLRIVQKKSN